MLCLFPCFCFVVLVLLVCLVNNGLCARWWGFVAQRVVGGGVTSGGCASCVGRVFVFVWLLGCCFVLLVCVLVRVCVC